MKQKYQMYDRFFLNDDNRYILSFIGYCTLKNCLNGGYFEIVEYADTDKSAGLPLSILLAGVNKLKNYVPFTPDAKGWYLRFDEVTYIPDSKDSQIYKICHQIRQELI